MTKVYAYNNKQVIVTHIEGTEAIVRPLPLSETEQVEFVPLSDLTLVGELDVVFSKNPEKPAISQPTPNHRPVNAQSTPSQLPSSGQASPSARTAIARAAKPDFDILQHYIQHYQVVTAILNPEFYSDSLSAQSAEELIHYKKFPRPLQRRLNNHFGFYKSRDFYRHLFEIHLQVEALRLPWFIEMTDRFIISLMQKLFTA